MLFNFCYAVPLTLLQGFSLNHHIRLDEGSSSCLVYNNSQMAMTLLGTVFAVKTISVLFYTLGVFASKRSRLKEEENTLSKSHAAATASK